MAVLRSRDNPRVKRWAKLSRDSRFRRAEQRALIEGPHLVSALLEKGLQPLALIVSEKGVGNPGIQDLMKRVRCKPAEVSDSILRAFVEVETPQGIVAEIEIPEAKDVKGSCVFLEGVQDAGNVGAIIRSAAAFGIQGVILDQACADAWSPKVLRAAMGGHFALSLKSVSDISVEARAFKGKLLSTVASEGVSLSKADLSGRLGWLFGSEGRGLGPELREAGRKIRIDTAPGTESLNVAAAAAICFYAAWSLGRSP